MPRLSLWNSGQKGKTYKFLDGAISQYFGISGTAVYVHLYEGPYIQDAPMINADGTIVPVPDANVPGSSGNVTSIQDVLFLENRDRKYAKDVFELRGVYNVNDLDFNLMQFSLMLQNDTLFIEFHLNDMISSLGRKLINGDVLELPHRRDDTSIQNGPAINKFYVVVDSSRSASGYAANWWPYIWRVKVEPMPASQEYTDILNGQQTNPYGWLDPGSVGDIMTTIGTTLGINDAVVAEAKINVPKRYFETQQLWMVLPETDPKGNAYPWVFAGDGIPPNGAIPLGTGRLFPDAPSEGDYYLRTDYHPATLFMWSSGAWRIQEMDWRGTDWSAAHRLLLTFINNDKISTFEDHTTAPEKVALSKAVKPRADF